MVLVAALLATVGIAPDLYRCQVEQVRAFRYGEELPTKQKEFLARQSFRFSSENGSLLWTGGDVGLRYEIVQQQGEDRDLVAIRHDSGAYSYSIQLLRIQRRDARKVDGGLSIPFVLLDGDIIQSGHCNVVP